MTTYQTLASSKLVRYQTIDGKACDRLDVYLVIVPSNVKAVSIQIMTRTGAVLFESPVFGSVEEALLWYSQLQYVDDTLYPRIGYYDKEGEFFNYLARLSDIC